VYYAHWAQPGPQRWTRKSPPRRKGEKRVCVFSGQCCDCTCVVTDAYVEEDYRKRLEVLMQLAELCIELLKQNDEHYADVSSVSFFISGFFSSVILLLVSVLSMLFSMLNASLVLVSQKSVFILESQ